MNVTAGDGPVTVAAATTGSFDVDVRSEVALEAVPATGHRFVRWTLSGGNGMLECAGQSCTLAIGSLTDDASASAAFEAVPRRLDVAAGAGGMVTVTGAGADATVAAATTGSFDVDVGSAVALEAVPDPGWRLLSWTLSGGNGMLACAGESCALAAGSLTADASATASFEAVPHRLAAGAGAGGSVTVTVDGAASPPVAAATTQGFDVDVRSAVALEAVQAAGHRFVRWTLSGGNGSLACAEGPLSNPCTLAAGSLTADASASAAFEAVFALTVSAGPGGSVAVAVDGVAAGTAVAGESTSVAVTALSAVTLTAEPAAGQRFDSWMLSGGNGLLSCDAVRSCALAAGSLTAAASATASFEVAPNSLEVAAGANGSVSVAVDGAAAGAAAAGESTSVAVAAGSVVDLTADPDDGWRLSAWTLSGGNGALACAATGDDPPNPCTLAAGSFTADATATATFAVVFALTVPVAEGGSVTVATGLGAPADATTGPFDVHAGSAVALTADPDDGWRLAGWTLSGGNAPLACAATVEDPPNPCTLAAGSFTANASATADFEAITYRLTAGAGAGGSVIVTVSGVAGVTEVEAATTGSFDVDVRSEVDLDAIDAPGWAFAGWTLSGGSASLACAEGLLSSLCSVATGSFTADASATATFEAVPHRLTAGAGAGGSVTVTGAGADATVGAAATQGFDVDVRSVVELEAVPDAGQNLVGWALSGGNGMLACVGAGPGAPPNPCRLAAGSFTADASATATFAAGFSLAVTAGAGGSVSVAVGGGAPVTVDAGNSTDVAVAAGSAVVLEALPANPNVFAGWTGACAGAGTLCELPAGASASAGATFGSAAMTLAVTAGAGGGVDVFIGQAAVRTVGAGRESTYVVAVASQVALTARPGFGRIFVRWTLSGGLACTAADSAICGLAAGSPSGGAAAVFGARQSTLTVSVDGDGSVAVTVGGAAAGSATAGNSTDVAVTVDDEVALAASPAVGARFVRWALSDGLGCQGGPQASPCMLDPVGADGSADAEFLPLPDSVTWTGPGAVRENGLALTAVPYADGAFEEWRGGGCDGSTETACGRPSEDARYPVAVFRPFVAAGIKSLAFGAGLPGRRPGPFQHQLPKRHGRRLRSGSGPRRSAARFGASAPAGARAPVAVGPGRLPDRGLRRLEQLQWRRSDAEWRRADAGAA